jgi:prephenate dehydratase
MKTKQIGIQGDYGAFHEIAAQYFFEGDSIEILPRRTFKELFKSLKEQQADFGIVAIENSIAGSILPNYALIRDSGKQIIGEIFLRIRHNLVALPGQSIQDIREVYSHPMAILQCQEFFNQYPDIRLYESQDTALSAKEIRDKNLYGVGAISSYLAAEKYNLDILAREIETNKLNYTRFLILSDKQNRVASSEKNKASIYFTLAHKIGSLSKILTVLSFYNMNLTKIQSLPVLGKEGEYQFYLDMEFDDYGIYKKAIGAIRPFSNEVGILGEFKKGRKIL